MAVVSILYPVFRIDKNIQNNLKRALIETSKKASKRLGYDDRLIENNKKEK